MNLLIKKSILNKKPKIKITGSKSESNRLLILQALYPNISIKNCSKSDDSVLMQKALKSKSKLIDIHHAGTAMRFLTAYFSIQENREVVITGSKRMQERPIKVLVEALIQLGADISYLNNNGFPPLKIIGKKLTNNKVTLKANVSSQYISALLLIASKLKNGLTITLEGKITSIPYINMTLSLLNQIGIETSFKSNLIEIKPQSAKLKSKTIIVESDWSSASYFYSIVALSPIGTTITLSSYKEDSLQGDSVLTSIYKQLGISTSFTKNSIHIKKEKACEINSLNCDLSNSPDIAQTIAVTCLGLEIPCNLTGLQTLKIKETDRLEALKTEIEKLGTEVTINQNSLSFSKIENLKEHVKIDTYNDHRMAMAFAPLALKIAIQINNPEVVSKSYPTFWEDLKSIGFSIQ